MNSRAIRSRLRGLVMTRDAMARIGGTARRLRGAGGAEERLGGVAASDARPMGWR